MPVGAPFIWLRPAVWVPGGYEGAAIAGNTPPKKETFVCYQKIVLYTYINAEKNTATHFFPQCQALRARALRLGCPFFSIGPLTPLILAQKLLWREPLLFCGGFR
jgi:hypothetical protein